MHNGRKRCGIYFSILPNNDAHQRDENRPDYGSRNSTCLEVDRLIGDRGYYSFFALCIGRIRTAVFDGVRKLRLHVRGEVDEKIARTPGLDGDIIACKCALQGLPHDQCEFKDERFLVRPELDQKPAYRSLCAGREIVAGRTEFERGDWLCSWISGWNFFPDLNGSCKQASRMHEWNKKNKSKQET